MRIKNESTFTPAPDGVHNAVCVDVVDLGMVEGPFGAKHKLNLVWQLEEKMESGKPFLVSKRYTATIHKKSALRKDLKSWRSKDFTDDEAKEFDLEKLVGVTAQLVIQHNDHEGVTYANVIAITKGKVKLTVQDYTRKKDREDYQAPSAYDPSKIKPASANHRGEPATFDGPPEDLKDADEIPF